MKPLVVIFFVSLLILSYYFFSQPQYQNSSSINHRATGCLRSGFLNKDGYLPTYTIKKGDTILSIAKNVLGDKSRVEELVKLNNDAYPSLSLKSPFVEPGWKLYLPPQNVSKTNGLIYIAAGKISTSDSGWGVNWSNSGIGPFSLSELPQEFHSGDCVVITYQGNDLQNPGKLSLFSIIKSD